VLVTTYAGDESRCSVLRSLQAANDDISDTVQRSITVKVKTICRNLMYVYLAIGVISNLQGGSLQIIKQKPESACRHCYVMLLRP